MAEPSSLKEAYERKMSLTLANDTAGPHDSDMSDLTDAKIAAAEARTDTKLAEAMGEVRLEFSRLGARMDKMPTTATLLTTVASAVVTIILAIVAIMSYGSQWFGLGLDASSAAQAGADRALAAYTAAHPVEAPLEPNVGNRAKP